MHRRTAAVAALLISASLTMAACSSGTDPEDKIEGADEANTPAPSASSSNGTASGSERPTITLPKSVNNVFEDTDASDRVKNQILADNEARINSIDKAITSGTIKVPALTFYSTGPALKSAVEYIKGYHQSKDTWTGTTQYFDRHVTVFDEKTAAVTYCSDESKAYIKDIETGKVSKEPPSKDSYVYYNTSVEKSEKGVWKTSRVTADRGAKKCQR